MSVQFNARHTGQYLSVLLLTPLLSGCFFQTLRIQESSDSVTRAVVVGDIRNIASGQATQLKLMTVEAGDFRYATGIGTLTGRAEEQGSALDLGDRFFVQSVADPQGARTEFGQQVLQTAYLVGVGSRAQPSARYRVRAGKEGMSLKELFERLSERHGELIAVAGVGEFAFLKGQAIKRPPTDGGSPFQSPGRYYFPEIRRYDEPAFFFAIALQDGEELVGSSSRIFEETTLGRLNAAQASKIGFATLETLEEVTLEDPDGLARRVTSVGEMSSLSQLRRGEIAVYEIEDIDRR